MALAKVVRRDFYPEELTIRLDGTMHRIVSVFVDVSDNDNNNPAAQWAMRTLDILTKCLQVKR